MSFRNRTQNSGKTCPETLAAPFSIQLKRNQSGHTFMTSNKLQSNLKMRCNLLQVPSACEQSLLFEAFLSEQEKRSVSLNRAFTEARTSRLVNPVISRQTCFPNSVIRLSAPPLGLVSILYPSKKAAHVQKGLFRFIQNLSRVRGQNTSKRKKCSKVRFLNDDFLTSFFISFSIFRLFFFWICQLYCCLISFSWCTRSQHYSGQWLVDP